MSHKLLSEHVSNDCIEAFKGLHDLAVQGTVVGAAVVVMLRRGRYFVDLTGAAARDPVLTRGMVLALDDELRELVHASQRDTPTTLT